MASINKSDCSADRRGAVGKGDLHAGPMEGYRNGAIWGKSGCCNAGHDKIAGRDFCQKCGNACKVVKG